MNTHTLTLYAILLAPPLIGTQLGNGCTSSPTKETPDRDTLDARVPRDAREVREGTGELSYLARTPGRIYLYDVEDHALVKSWSLRRNQEFILVPNENRATIDGRVVYDEDLKKKHAHRLYFLPDDRSELEHDDRVPRGAVRVADGGGKLTWQARDDGRLIIYDENDDRVVLERPIRNRQEVLVDPEKDLIEVDGRRAYDGNLVKDHSHRIYFQKE